MGHLWVTIGHLRVTIGHFCWQRSYRPYRCGNVLTILNECQNECQCTNPFISRVRFNKFTLGVPKLNNIWLGSLMHACMDDDLRSDWDRSNKFRVTIGNYFFSISEHKAKTTELHPNVRQTC